MISKAVTYGDASSFSLFHGIMHASRNRDPT